MAGWNDQKAIFWGALTGLTTLAFSYMSSDISHTPFIPALFFSRPLGSPPDFTAIASSAAAYLLIGGLFGAGLQQVNRHWRDRILPASWLGAGILWLLIVLGGWLTHTSNLLSTGVLIWQAVLSLVWGWILSRLVREMDQVSLTGEGRQRMTPRQFRYLVIAGALTAIISALRIFYMRSGR
jgi:hypothetical protein